MTPQVPPRDENSWTEYRRLIIDFCEDTKCRLDEIEDRLGKIDLEINSIKIKIAFVAGIAGFIGSLIPVLVQYFLSLK
jgi:VIT1/CCC1 family predicted Fe2+/Mn2+ transporter